jgi:hypothetical protein
VVLNGETLEYGEADGWTLSDGRTIVLLGDACTTVLIEESVSLEITFPCGC